MRIEDNCCSQAISLFEIWPTWSVSVMGMFRQLWHGRLRGFQTWTTAQPPRCALSSSLAQYWEPWSFLPSLCGGLGVRPDDRETSLPMLSISTHPSFRLLCTKPTSPCP